MNEQLILFEGQEEIKVKTDQGETLINLANSAKVCGLVITDNKRGTIRIAWKGKGSLSDKLDKIRENLVKSKCEVSTSQENYDKYIEEIEYILNEIENSDDRNSIFMSNWLTRRLAMNCNSSKAESYKNYLATLDEKYSNGQLQVSNQEVANLISNTVQGLVPIMVTEITKQFAPIILESKNEVKKVIGLMYDQSVIYESERNELKNLIGFRSVNTKKIVNTIKDMLSEKLGYNVMANSNIFQKVKKEIFKEFDVVKWEDISVCNYTRVFAFVDEYIGDLKVAN